MRPSFTWPDIDWSTVFGFEHYGELLGYLQNSIIAGAVLGLVGGLIGVFVMRRDFAFAVHGIAELSFAGAAFALLFGMSVVAGSVGGAIVAALIIGLLGSKAQSRNSIVGVLMPFGLGLGILFLALFPGRSANKFSLLTGQIVSVSNPDLGWLIGISFFVLVALILIWNPLTFDSLDPEPAAARGVPTRAVSMSFMLLLALIVAVSVQVIGALLVMALLVTPAAAAMKVASGPVMVPVLASLFGFVSAVGGILIALGSTLPISPFITTLSFAIYLVCWAIHGVRNRVSPVTTSQTR